MGDDEFGAAAAALESTWGEVVTAIVCSEAYARAELAYVRDLPPELSPAVSNSPSPSEGGTPLPSPQHAVLFRGREHRVATAQDAAELAGWLAAHGLLAESTSPPQQPPARRPSVEVRRVVPLEPIEPGGSGGVLSPGFSGFGRDSPSASPGWVPSLTLPPGWGEASAAGRRQRERLATLRHRRWQALSLAVQGQREAMGKPRNPSPQGLQQRHPVPHAGAVLRRAAEGRLVFCDPRSVGTPTVGAVALCAIAAVAAAAPPPQPASPRRRAGLGRARRRRRGLRALFAAVAAAAAERRRGRALGRGLGLLRRLAPEAASPLSAPQPARKQPLVLADASGKGDPCLVPQTSSAIAALRRRGDDMMVLLRTGKQRSRTSGAGAAPEGDSARGDSHAAGSRPAAPPSLPAPTPDRLPAAAAAPAAAGPAQPSGAAPAALPPAPASVAATPEAGPLSYRSYTGTAVVPPAAVRIPDPQQQQLQQQQQQQQQQQPPGDKDNKIRRWRASMSHLLVDYGARLGVPPAERVRTERIRLREMEHRLAAHSERHSRQRRAERDRERALFSMRLSHVAAMAREQRRHGTYDQSHPTKRRPRKCPLSGLPSLPRGTSLPWAASSAAPRSTPADEHPRAATAPAVPVCSLLPSPYSPSHLRRLPELATPPPPAAPQQPAPFFRPGTADHERRTHVITATLYSRFDISSASPETAIDVVDCPTGLNRLNQWAMLGPGAATAIDAIAKVQMQEEVFRKTPIGNATPSYWDRYNDYAATVKHAHVRCCAPPASEAPDRLPACRSRRGEERLRRQLLYRGKVLGLGRRLEAPRPVDAE